MNFSELNQYKYLFLDTINSTNENALTITLNIGEVSTQMEDLTINGVILHDTRPILEDKATRIKLIFHSYVAYNVRWETYTVWSDYDIFKGQIVREYSKSRYLEYIKNDSIASDEWPGILKHFGICCTWEIIDVVSVNMPEIYIEEREIRNA